MFFGLLQQRENKRKVRLKLRRSFSMVGAHFRRLGRAQRARLKSSSLARTREGHPVGGGNFATSQKPFIVFEEVKSEEVFVLR